jgi:RNA polymerase sigma factor for flagellar operon FliA
MTRNAARRDPVSSREERDLLVSEHEKFARVIAGQVLNSLSLSKDFLDDAVSCAYVGLVEAAERYDPSSGVPFRGYAYIRIRGAVIDGLRGVTGSSRAHRRRLRVSQHALLDIEESGAVRHVSRQNATREEKLGVLLDLVSRVSVSFSYSEREAENNFGVELVTPQHELPEEIAIRKQTQKNLKKAFETLSDEDRFILEGIHHRECTLDELGAELGGVSKSWVSRKHTRALDRLREALEALEK